MMQERPHPKEVLLQMVPNQVVKLVHQFYLLMVSGSHSRPSLDNLKDHFQDQLKV